MNSPANTPDLSNLWMPFTANRQFKQHPRLLAKAKGMYYTASDGHRILDGTAGLWCVNAGHGRQEIIDAISRQAAELDYAPSFQLGHGNSFQAASAVATLMTERSEEHTTELQTLQSISYDVLCLNKKK